MFSKIKALHQFTKMQIIRHTLWLMLIFFLVFFISGLLSYFLARDEFSHELEKELKRQYQALQSLTHTPKQITVFNQHIPSTLIGFKHNDQTVYGSDVPELYQQTGIFVLKHFLVPKHINDTDWLVYSADETSGRLSVAMSFGELVDEPLEIVFRTFVFSFLIASCLGLAGGLLLGLREQKRFNRISHQLQAISQGDLSQRIENMKPNDNLSQIAHELNHTTAQLDTLIHQIKHLTASLAHDLKTPLARLRAELEQAHIEEEKQPTNTQQQNHIVTLASATTHVDHIIETFDAILRIARIQALHKDTNKKPVPLAKVLEQIHETYADYAEDTEHHLMLDLKHQPIIQGDNALLAQLVANLVENALRYTPKGSHITLATTLNGLCVYDDGHGVPEAEYERILQPMYQIDKSRNVGTGLGLAMVKAISDFHNATLTLSASYPEQKRKGLCIQIAFN